MGRSRPIGWRSGWTAGSVRRLFVGVSTLGEEFSQTALTLRKVRLCDCPGEHDAVFIRYSVQNVDWGAVAQEDALGINDY